TSLEVNKVVNANQTASYEAVRHLLDQGYRRIIYLGGPQELSMYQERLAGYKQALEESGIPVDEELIFLAVTTREAGAGTLRKVLEKGIEFDAVAGASDFSALGAMLTIQEAGYAIPEEKGIVGFANESFTELIGMSSVEQYSVEMGKAAANLLLEAINDSSAGQADKPLQQVVIEPHLITRRSSMRTNR
ncbi:MAG: substrate-binding domain-containing protein, partial [Bacteroidota bacterium]